tara:strand:- start:4925 stop:5200 length:276 start_codon:yes stop_codon:yes gene_type:complete
MTSNRPIAQRVAARYLEAAFRSHGYEPEVGDMVLNTNPDCVHFGSQGKVLGVNDLPGGAGKTIQYKCTNSGKNWDVGDTLDKTPDQLDMLP